MKFQTNASVICNSTASETPLSVLGGLSRLSLDRASLTYEHRMIYGEQHLFPFLGWVLEPSGLTRWLYCKQHDLWQSGQRLWRPAAFRPGLPQATGLSS